MRRPKTDRVPRTRAGGQWTEAAYYGFIRSGLRLLSRKWPPRRDILKQGRRPYVGPNKRQKFEYSCEDCGGWFPAKQIEIDHIDPCGKLTSLDDLPGFVERLLCEIDKLRKLCETCHAKRTKGAK